MTRKTNTMTRDEALDLATDLYLSGAIDHNPTDTWSNKWLESVLTRWAVKVA